MCEPGLIKTGSVERKLCIFGDTIPNIIGQVVINWNIPINYPIYNVQKEMQINLILIAIRRNCIGLNIITGID